MLDGKNIIRQNYIQGDKHLGTRGKSIVQLDSENNLMPTAKLTPPSNPGCYKPMVAWMPLPETERARERHHLPTDNKPRFFNCEPPVKAQRYYERMEFACKQCISCRLNKSMEWAGRIAGESKLYERNCFLTLTYSDENLPENNVLSLPDLQKFKKRLRKKCHGHQEVYGVKLRPGQKNPIRSYECGEYGDQFGRAHYHMALLNYKPYDLEYHKTNKHGDKLYTSKTLDAIWGLGKVYIGELNVSSASYVARYITKKINGDAKAAHYAKINQETGECYTEKQEFATMSRKPGIGVPFFNKYKSDFMQGKMTMRSRTGQILQRKIPVHFQNLLEQTHPTIVAELKEERVKWLKQQQRDNPQEFTQERRAVKQIVFEAQIKHVKRKAVA